MSELLTPRERGILAGLADRWGDNPYDQRYPETRESIEYQIGFRIGQKLLALLEEGDK